MNIVGLVEIRLLNADTLEVEQEVTTTNTLTYSVWDRWARLTNVGNNIIISADDAISTKDFSRVWDPIFGFVPVGATSPQIFSATETTPLYVQWTNRFNAPTAGTSRTINTVGLTSATIAQHSTVECSAYVKLTAPCIQTDTQLLDVTYRMQFTRDANICEGINTDPRVLYNQVYYMTMTTTTTSYSFPSAILHSPMRAAYTPESGKYGYMYGHDVSSPALGLFTGTGTTVTNNYDYIDSSAYPLFKRYIVGTADTSGGVGRIYGSEYYRTATSMHQSWKNIIAPTGSNIQPIHSHASSTFSLPTAHPFLDSLPSTGTGSVIGGGTWTRPDYPEEYLIKMTTAGGSGVASYQFWKRNHFGFAGTTYGNRTGVFPWLTAVNYGETPSSPIPHPPGMGTHGVLNHRFAEWSSQSGSGSIIVAVNFTEVAKADATGVTIINLSTGEYTNFDATTAPTLPVTGLQQISVNKTTGDIWVACAQTGLWKISADRLTVTHITVAGHGVPSDQSYGVDVGRLDSIWAVFNGGIASSFDDGATWTTYNPSTPTAFSFTGITDGNWNTVRYLKVDPSHPDDQLALIRNYYTSVLQSTAVVWWSRGNPTTTAIVTTNEVMNSARLSPHTLDVSDEDNFWVATLCGHTSQFQLRRLAYGTTSATAFGPGSYIGGIAFEKGPGGETCCIIIAGAGASTTAALYNKIGTAVIPSVLVDSGEDYFGYYYLNHLLYLGKGIFTAVNHRSSHFGQTIAVIPDTRDSLTGPFSYLIWEKYGWNGSGWERDHPGSKITHTVQEELLNGVTISFTDGVTGTSFIANDYYTFGVCDGILKDNSIAYTTRSSFYIAPMKKGTTFNGVVREHPSVGVVQWRKTSKSLTVNPDNSLTNTYPQRKYNLWAYSTNRVFGDFVVTGTINSSVGTQYIELGLTVDKTGAAATTYSYLWNDVPNTYTFRVYDTYMHNYIGTTAGGPTTVIGTNTPWEIRRVGSTLTWLVNGVVRHTVTDASHHSFAIRVTFSQYISASQVQVTIPPITVVSSGTGYYTEVGEPGPQTGIYDPGFLALDWSTEAAGSTQYYLDGVPVTYTMSNSVTAPAPGEVNVMARHGTLLFNAADLGKTVTGNYIYISDEG